MQYFVILYDLGDGDGAFLDEHEEAEVEDFEFGDCVSLAKYFNDPVEYSMNKDSPDRRNLYDLVDNIDELLIISEQFKKILQQQECGEIEFLPIRIKDQKDKLINDNYYIVNTLDSVDYIDAGKSEIKYNNINPSLIRTLSKLVLKEHAIPQGHCLFRTKTYGECYVVNEKLKQIIEKNELEGIRFIPVDEYNSIKHR